MKQRQLKMLKFTICFNINSLDYMDEEKNASECDETYPLNCKGGLGLISNILNLSPCIIILSSP